MPVIDTVTAREILDSRGNPTVEVEVLLDNGVRGRAAVPSGASTGEKEAVELRDGDPARYRGKGVQNAVRHVQTELAEAVVGYEAIAQQAIDRALMDCDGTDGKGRLGANALLGVSLAVARAAAASAGIPLYRYLGGVGACLLPVPLLNILNGGMHAGTTVDIQEFMVVPAGFPNFQESLRAATEVYHALASVLKERKLSTGIGDEGGFAPALRSNEEALDLVMEAIARAGYGPGEDVWIALDCAASSFCREGTYQFRAEGRSLTSEDLVRLYEGWVERYPIVSIEDGLAENDAKGWKMLTASLGGRVQLVGDDVFCTNPALLSGGIADGIANAILIKVNQIGTLSETIETIELARSAAYAQIISHRSGETEDAFIADLAVAVGCGQIKTGAPCRGERTAKYNQLLRIEEELRGQAEYAGREAFRALR